MPAYFDLFKELDVNGRQDLPASQIKSWYYLSLPFLILWLF